MPWHRTCEPWTLYAHRYWALVVADLGGAREACPTSEPEFLNFLCSFREKLVIDLVGWRPLPTAGKSWICHYLGMSADTVNALDIGCIRRHWAFECPRKLDLWCGCLDMSANIGYILGNVDACRHWMIQMNSQIDLDLLALDALVIWVMSVRSTRASTRVRDGAKCFKRQAVLTSFRKTSVLCLS